YLRVDSAGTPVARTPGPLSAPSFASFVSDPPPPPPDSTLAVGGVPSARSILRIAFPHFIRDSSQIIRGTLTLVPVAPVQGAPKRRRHPSPRSGSIPRPPRPSGRHSRSRSCDASRSDNHDGGPADGRSGGRDGGPRGGLPDHQSA